MPTKASSTAGYRVAIGAGLAAIAILLFLVYLLLSQTVFDDEVNGTLDVQIDTDFVADGVQTPHMDYTDVDDDGNPDYYIFSGCVTDGADNPDTDPAAWQSFANAVTDVPGTDLSDPVHLNSGTVGTDDEPASSMTVTVTLDNTLSADEAEQHALQVLGILDADNPCA
jgi:hypothetical protein